MAFVQIIEFRTASIDAMQQVADRREEATAGKRTAGRRILCRDATTPAATSSRLSRQKSSPCC